MRKRTIVTRRMRIAFLATAFGVAVTGGYVLRGWASGIPSTGALSYAGYLEDANGAVTGMHNLQVYFYDAASNGNILCQTTPTPLGVVNGRFSSPLPDTCTSAVSGSPNVWVDVVVDGSDTGRVKIGAVPYAVEANHAVAASSAAGTLTQQIVPTGAVMFFDLAACPAGWSDATAAQGRYLVGMPTTGTLGGTVGTALADKENRAVGQHTHIATDTGHIHGAEATDGEEAFVTSGTGTGAGLQGGGNGYALNPNTTTGFANIQVQASGSVAGTNAPYVQYRVCVKD